MSRREWLACGVVLAACGGPSSSPAAPPPPPAPIDLALQGDGSAAAAVSNRLDQVSHDSLGYTGEIDRYAIVSPATGRLQASLSWDHGADFDLIVALDENAHDRLAEGISNDDEPEYVGVPVEAGQELFLVVAGYAGDPGGYTLEVVLLPPDAPLFDLVDAPDPSQPLPRNLPLVFTFNVELDAAQPVVGHVSFVAPGEAARGIWCIEGKDLVFYPLLPHAPDGHDAGLADGATYTLQIPRAARGLRAVTGEYLDALVQTAARFQGFADEDPASPPRVVDVDRSVGQPWDGAPLTITILGGLDPATVDLGLFRVAQDGTETPLPARVTFLQDYGCLRPLLARLTVEPVSALPPGSRVRVRVPATVLGFGGDAFNDGQPFVVDFLTP
ncbi:MAG: hypothetical protein ACREID_09580 [Planctomycetota bacterium]